MSLCERCGAVAPTRHVVFRRHIGLIVPWVQQRTEGDLCRPCIDEVFTRETAITAVLGWWGIFSVFITPVVIFLNVREWSRAKDPQGYVYRPEVVDEARDVGETDLSLEPRPPSPEEAVLDFDALPPARGGSTLPAEWWIAMGHLRSKKNEAFISIVTILSILGVVVGVAVLNMVLAVMTGFEQDMRDKILGANAHLVVLRYGGNVPDGETLAQELEELDGVVAAAPFVYTEMMIRSPWSTGGIVLKGMDPDRTGRVTDLLEDLEHGPGGELHTMEEKRAVFELMRDGVPPLDAVDGEGEVLPGLLVGRELMEHLQVAPGDEVQVINPLGSGAGPMGMPTPSVKRFRVAGVFFSGMYEYDAKWTYVHNPVARDFLKIGSTSTGLELAVEDVDRVEQVAQRVDAHLGYPYYTRHWKSMNQELFEALALEKFVMGLILSLIVAVAGLLIVTTLIMMVLTKGREIAILKAMGAGSESVMRVFVMEGTVIGLIGTVMGTILGLIGCWGLDKYEYPLQTDVYYLATLPVVVEPWTVVVVAVGAFVVCFLATLYPAWQASSLDPVEGLRYE